MIDKKALSDALTKAFIGYQHRLDCPMPIPHETEEMTILKYRTDPLFHAKVKSLVSVVMRIVGEHLDEGRPMADKITAEQQPVEQQSAPNEQMVVVGWQFYQDGKWWNGDDRIKDHRKNTAAAGIPVRDLYATPQPAEQQPTCPTCLGGGWDIDCQNRFRPVTCPDCAGSGKFEHSITAQESDSVAPDVTALVEALEAIVSHHDEYFGDSSAESKMPWIGQARAALAAHRKQGGEV